MYPRHLGLSLFALGCAAADTTTTAIKKTFDYVVIGGGTAGLVVAARLSENPNVTVAVIEAGANRVDEPLVYTPQAFGQAIGNPSFDWNFATVPQPGLNNAVVPQPRGKMLGGSSGLNFMVWDRASAQEYDAWEQLGSTGWNWNSLLPYFKKTETVTPQTPEQTFPGTVSVSSSTFTSFHGESGPLQASYNLLYCDVTDPFVEALNGLGIPTNSDPYMGNGTGVYNTEMAIDRVNHQGKRSFSANTYYNSSRPNLTIFPTTQATRINLASVYGSSNLQAGSVNVVALNSTTGVSGTIYARKEVILAAGALQTPQLLELSGIGNKTILQAAGVKTLINLPGVGSNLQDHTLLVQDFEITNTSFSYDQLRNNATYLAEQQAEYAANGTGIFASAQFAPAFPPLTQVVSADIFSTISQNANSLLQAPGLSNLTKAQYQLQADWLAADDIATLEFIMFPSGGISAIPPEAGHAYMTIFLGNMHPFSRGTVHINSSNPLVQPVIDPRYVSNDVDLQVVLEGAKFVRTIAESQPLAASIVGPHQPSAAVSSDDDWLAFVKQYLGTVYHPIGTAAMLPKALGGVVDPKTLTVYGTSNLRVVDASVIPLLIATHPQSSIYAIAERASDIIKGLI